MLNWYKEHESGVYINPSFVQLSRLAVTLRVKLPRSGANRHALFIVVGGASMGNSLSGVKTLIQVFVGISMSYVYSHTLSNQRPVIN